MVNSKIIMTLYKLLIALVLRLILVVLSRYIPDKSI